MGIVIMIPVSFCLRKRRVASPDFMAESISAANPSPRSPEGMTLSPGEGVRNWDYREITPKLDKPQPSTVYSPLSLLCHLIGLWKYFFIMDLLDYTTFQLLGMLTGPGVILLIYLFAKDSEVHKDIQEALNFQTSLTQYFFISFLLMTVVIGYVLIFSLIVFDLICSLSAVVRTRQGREFHYPFSLKIFR